MLLMKTLKAYALKKNQKQLSPNFSKQPFILAKH